MGQRNSHQCDHQSMFSQNSIVWRGVISFRRERERFYVFLTISIGPCSRRKVLGMPKDPEVGIRYIYIVLDSG